jgi:hypothetical protein
MLISSYSEFEVFILFQLIIYINNYNTLNDLEKEFILGLPDMPLSKYYCRYTSNDTTGFSCINLENNYSTSLSDWPMFDPFDDNEPYMGSIEYIHKDSNNHNYYLQCPSNIAPTPEKKIFEPDCGIDTMYRGLYAGPPLKLYSSGQADNSDVSYNIFCRYINSDNGPQFSCVNNSITNWTDIPRDVTYDNIPYNGESITQFVTYSNGYIRGRDISYNCPVNTAPKPSDFQPYCGDDTKYKGWYKFYENSDDEFYCRDIDLTLDPSEQELNCSLKNSPYIRTFYGWKSYRDYDGGYYNCPSKFKNIFSEETKLVQEETKLVQEETKLVQEETKSLQEETKSLQEETKSLQEETKLPYLVKAATSQKLSSPQKSSNKSINIYLGIGILIIILLFVYLIKQKINKQKPIQPIQPIQ